MSRQIPGFYYDEEKKKYFKIQPNHAVPAGSTYSADRIKSRRLELEDAAEIARTVRRRSRFVRRAGILQDPLLGGSLSREQGHGCLLDGTARAFVEGLDGQEIFPSEASPSHDPRTRAMNRLFYDEFSSYTPLRVEEYAHMNAGTVAMGAFHFDHVTNGLFYPLNGQILCGVVERKHTLKMGEVYKPIILRQGTVQLSINQSMINSINIDPRTRFMLTTWRAPATGHNIHLVKLDGGEWGNGRFSGGDMFFHGYHTADILGIALTSRISSITDVASTLWSATASVPGSPFVFAIATDNGVMAIDEMANTRAVMNSPVQPSGQRTAVLAVECLSQHPSVVLGGTRSGHIMLFDVREAGNEFQSGAQTITHPSSVYKIKQVNDHIVVAAGLNSTLCNYDLRFLKRLPRERIWLNHQSASAERSLIVGDKVIQPLFLYPEHNNSAQVELGFDVDLDAGIVAAAQYDSSKTVSIFSMRTGRLLRSLSARDTAFGLDDTAEVKALKFVQENDGRKMKSLWVAKGTRIVRFAW